MNFFAPHTLLNAGDSSLGRIANGAPIGLVVLVEAAVRCILPDFERLNVPFQTRLPAIRFRHAWNVLDDGILRLDVRGGVLYVRILVEDRLIGRRCQERHPNAPPSGTTNLTVTTVAFPSFAISTVGTTSVAPVSQLLVTRITPAPSLIGPVATT